MSNWKLICRVQVKQYDVLGGIYRHPNGKVSHCVSALERLLNELNNGRTTIIAGDIDIDIVNVKNIDVIYFMTTMVAYKYLPSSITQLSNIAIKNHPIINYLYWSYLHEMVK